MAILGSIRHREVAEHIGTIPNAEDISNALCRMSNGKSGGLSGIVPELLKAGGGGGGHLCKLLWLISFSLLG